MLSLPKTSCLLLLYVWKARLQGHSRVTSVCLFKQSLRARSSEITTLVKKWLAIWNFLQFPRWQNNITVLAGILTSLPRLFPRLLCELPFTSVFLNSTRDVQKSSNSAYILVTSTSYLWIALLLPRPIAFFERRYLPIFRFLILHFFRNQYRSLWPGL